MKNFAKWLLRSLAIGVVWVFILAIEVKGQTVFDRAHDVFIQNRLVQAIDEQIVVAWDQFRAMARTALSDQEKEVPLENF